MSKLTRPNLLIGDTDLLYAGIRGYAGAATHLRCTGIEVVGDGGEGHFYLDLNDKATADNGGTVLVDSLNRRWKRAYSGGAKAAWFGAKPDGVTDSSSAITAALLSCGHVNLHRGKLPYVINNNVVVSDDFVQLIGVGMPEVMITGGDKNLGAIELTGSNTEIRNIRFTSTTDITPVRLGNIRYGSADSRKASNVKASNLRMVSTGFKGPNHGNLVFIGANNITAERIMCTGKPTAGSNIEVLGCENGLVVDCYAENGILGNIHVTSADGQGYPSHKISIDNCTAVHAIEGISGDNNIKVSRDCTAISITNCRTVSRATGTFGGNAHAILLQGTRNCKIVGNVIEMIGTGVEGKDFKSAIGLHDHTTPVVGNTNTIIEGNTIVFTDPGNNNRGIFMYTGGNTNQGHIKISNNMLFSNRDIEAFLSISNNNAVGSSGTIKDITFTDNMDNGSASTIKARTTNTALGVINHYGNIRKGGNPTFDIQSAALRSPYIENKPTCSTVTLDATDYKLPLSRDNNVHQTIILQANTSGSTVTIDGFTQATAGDGQLVTITSSYNLSNVKIKHGGTGRFRLSGNADFNLTGFSSLTLMAVGSDWVEVSRR